MALVGHIDETGIHIPTYPALLAELQGFFRAIFGEDVYLDADSQEGQMLAMFAMALHDANLLAQSVYNAFSPQTAQGAGLSRMVRLNGIARLPASRSTVDLTLTGQPGTVITGGVAQDVAGQKWRLPDTVVIPVGGEITVTAQAADPGAIQAAAGEVNAIATPTRGWLSVTNALAATPGVAAESDAALRTRQRVSTALPSQTVLEGIVGAVANVSGVIRLKMYENDTDEPDSNGIPSHSLALVVEGGDVADIAGAVAGKKTPGCGTYGDITLTVADRYGMPSAVRFSRPVEVPVVVEVTIAPRAGYVSPTGAAIRENLAEYFNALNIGEDVLLSKLYTPINAAEPSAGKRSFDVTGLVIARGIEAPATANLSIAYNEVVVGLADNVTVIVAEA
ncbi:baseplate J/gp47 family protein [Pseudodesulfovibrio pelocollis]|uniref:baseplate J/gp47 family protein n=1 Tax=Pseudodesulfovibrio pelocollis TaxID=3051432 RepID=UPI00255AA7F5|nr:baseplate J/gp47 family protein [Pseudodesulfovibrio sp. SB368]